jgi:hypothetical protein
MSGVTMSSPQAEPDFLLRSAASTAPGVAVFAFDGGVDAQDSSGTSARQLRAYAGPAAAA